MNSTNKSLKIINQIVGWESIYSHTRLNIRYNGSSLAPSPLLLILGRVVGSLGGGGKGGSLGRGFTGEPYPSWSDSMVSV